MYLTRKKYTQKKKRDKLSNQFLKEGADSNFNNKSLK